MEKTINAKIELVELLKKNSDFRDIFENYLWEVFKTTRNLYGSNLYRIYYDLSKSTFTAYELTNSGEWIPNDDLIFIIDMDGGIWDALQYEYDAVKEYLESTGDEIAYSFDEWVEEEIKNNNSGYMDNTIDSIIRNLQDDIEYEGDNER